MLSAPRPLHGRPDHPTSFPSPVSPGSYLGHRAVSTCGYGCSGQCWARGQPRGGAVASAQRPEVHTQQRHVENETCLSQAKAWSVRYRDSHSEELGSEPQKPGCMSGLWAQPCGVHISSARRGHGPSLSKAALRRSSCRGSPRSCSPRPLQGARSARGTWEGRATPEQPRARPSWRGVKPPGKAGLCPGAPARLPVPAQLPPAPCASVRPGCAGARPTPPERPTTGSWVCEVQRAPGLHSAPRRPRCQSPHRGPTSSGTCRERVSSSFQTLAFY